MIKGLDTNVLVRYLTQDDERQAEAAAKAIEGAAAKGEKMLIQPIILCELVWVLESAYDFPKTDLLRVLEGVLRIAQFEIAEKDTVWQALSDYRQGKGDFSDYYLGRANEKAGAAITLTFDKTLKGIPRFHVLTA
ncbi:MAG: type II toxin-antitoxin system VapC family toxin [Thermodesulfobacteriota bacterium]|nr:type II toxin-antitoxin system VapC family toxin [Thermodesulfobacteriota bacterium]